MLYILNTFGFGGITVPDEKFDGMGNYVLYLVIGYYIFISGASMR